MATDPTTLYKDGETRSIASIDLPGWIEAGWSTEPEAPAELEIPAEPETDSNQKPKGSKKVDDGIEK
jgi:hypothetical protein